jgi:MtN3 and saliva related transmembrane protein
MLLAKTALKTCHGRSSKASTFPSPTVGTVEKRAPWVAGLMVEPWIEAIGLLAGLLGIVAWVPQIREVWVHQRHEGISLSTFSVVTVALVLWLIYGVLISSMAMIVANVFTLVVILAVLIGVRRLRRLESDAST